MRRAARLAAASAFLAVALGAVQQVSVPDLVGYWRLDETASPSADSSGFNHPAAWTGNPTPSNLVPPAGPPGIGFPNPNCLSFDGVDDLATASGFSWPAPGGPVTVAYWSFVATADVRNSIAFTVGNQNNPNRFQIHGPWGDNVLYWDYGDIGGTGRISTSYTAYRDKWTHVAVVSAGEGGAFKAIYLDGVLATSVASSDGPNVVLNGLLIGRGETTLWHKGRIDDFRIYDRVLSAPEITTLHQGQLPGAFTVTAADGVGQVDVSWTASAGAVDYQVQVNGVNQGAPQTGTTFTHTGGTVGATYTYTVIASNIVGTTSSTDDGTFLLPPPRTNNHEEGLFGDRCSCGSSASAPGFFASLLAAALGAVVLAAAARRA